MADSIAGVSYDVEVLAKQVELQNEAIDHAVSMAVAAETRSKFLLGCNVELEAEIWNLRRDVRNWAIMVMGLAAWLLVFVVCWALGLL